jgi:phosphoglucan,water dikinase
MVRIGNQTSAWAATPTEPFDYALAQDFDAFEWFPDKKPDVGWDDSDLDGQTRQRIAEIAGTRGLRFSVHARWQANLLTPEGIALFWKDFDLARDLGATLINIHLDHEAGLSAFVNAIIPLIRRTAEAGFQLSIENTPHHTPEHFNELFAKLRALDSPQTIHVGMCLDLGHANLCAATRNDYLQFYDRLDPHLPLIHLHLHENWGDSDSHLPLFTGPSACDDSGVRGLVARLKKRNYSGLIILEQWPHPPSLLNNARDRLLQLWPPEPGTPPRNSDRELSAPPPHILPKPSEADFVSELVEGDRTRRSWREKLDFVRDLLARGNPAVTSDQLVYIAIYLRYLGTGEIACSEDGRHFRPEQHARLAAQIQDRLAKLTTPDNQFIVRKIYPWLPSSAPTFQRPEPLTRIRDIAHRNDIPQDLKREIKTTLQNKLHRCAGPEDLVTSGTLLQRITAPGAAYSPAFVGQFKIFHEELKEFFNTQSLEQRLTAIAPAFKANDTELLQRFLKQKTRLSVVAAGVSPAVEPGVPPGGSPALKSSYSRGLIQPGGGTPPSTSGGTPDATTKVPGELLEAFHTLTDLRRACLHLVEQKPGAETEAILLADIALEDFAFVLLSELINSCEKSDTNSAAQCESEALILSLQNLALSGVDSAESRALINELRAWGKPSASASRNECLRQKATLQRCRRLAEDFGASVIALLSARAEKLGRALKVEAYAIRVFSEADIRSHIVFQVSKLATSLLRRIRRQLKLPPWDVLVPGQAAGRATIVASLDDWEKDSQDAAVLLLKQAAGDEEIPRNVAGIVLAHEMPHLSHLAVRARQAAIVFVACEEADEFDRLQKLQGQMVSLQAAPDTVSFNTTPQVDSSPAVDSSSPIPRREGQGEGYENPFPTKALAQRPSLGIPAVQMSAATHCLPLEQATTENSGGKADGARRLLELSRQEKAGFLTVPALVVPFGIMEETLRSAPALDAEYKKSANDLDKKPHAEFETAVNRLRELVQKVTVPDAICSEVRQKFSANTPLVVRSSANCEDTEQFAGAGLYESVINVSPADVAAAIRKVWSSLWTLRAALSRREVGIPHEQAHMAVLVQELVNADFAFVLHTVNPITRDPRALYAEIVAGLGETLVSAETLGEPYRLTCDKQSEAVTILAFANFSKAARPNSYQDSLAFCEGAGRGEEGLSQTGLSEKLSREILDYSKSNLSRDPATLESLGRRLCRIGTFVERALGKAQDIEGAIVQDKIYLVQARPQQGLANGNQ